ncbi:hypothetical protein VM1G_00596 [Cytospora mali]|uniref:Alternative oxidase n=1 Tax=Cytospora mali TaxID=578113 RepID=A0A194VML7_CYTMA|nr:hypothetical protein VM1G_00596 [Valsa mali]
MALPLGDVVRTGRPQLIKALCISLLLAIWALRLQMPEMSLDYSWGIHNNVPKVENLGRPDVSSDFDLSDPDAPFIGWPLRRACSEVPEWVDGLVWMCDNNWGGVGNVRNFILTCIRYAIEAGVTGLVVPTIGKRNDEDISDYMSGKESRPLGYMFDEENFRQAMGENCPQITIYDSWMHIPNVTVPSGAGEPDIQKIDPREYNNRESCNFAELDRHTDRFGDQFRDWVFRPETYGKPPSAEHPRIFRMVDWPGVLWEWPTWHDGPELANTFGGLLKFNRQVMRLGKAALTNMHQFARDHASAHQPRQNATSSNGSPPHSFHDNSAFLGVHLRTEADAERFWPSYEEQERAYLAKAEEMGFAVAYVATGNLSEARKLASAAQDRLGMAVLTKADLLDGADAEEMASMSWDQQGLVDHVVLAGAGYFVGNSRSSFSILLAQKRHLKADGLYTRPYKPTLFNVTSSITSVRSTTSTSSDEERKKEEQRKKEEERKKKEEQRRKEDARILKIWEELRKMLGEEFETWEEDLERLEEERRERLHSKKVWEEQRKKFEEQRKKEEKQRLKSFEEQHVRCATPFRLRHKRVDMQAATWTKDAGQMSLENCLG